MSRKLFKIPVVLTDEEVRKFLSVFNTRYISPHKNLLICRVSLESGLRISEVISLKVEDVDWNTGKVHIKEGKGKRDRIVFFNSTLLEEVKKLKDRLKIGSTGLLFPNNKGKMLDKNNVNRMLKTYGKKSGVEKHFTFHTFRHTYGTKLYKETGDIRIVQKVLGHSDISTTQIYTHIYDKDVYNVMMDNNPYSIQ